MICVPLNEIMPIKNQFTRYEARNKCNVPTVSIVNREKVEEVARIVTSRQRKLHGIGDPSVSWAIFSTNSAREYLISIVTNPTLRSLCLIENSNLNLF